MIVWLIKTPFVRKFIEHILYVSGPQPFLYDNPVPHIYKKQCDPESEDNMSIEYYIIIERETERISLNKPTFNEISEVVPLTESNPIILGW